MLRRPAFLLLVPLTLAHYAPVAGVRGLWAGPYLADVFGLGAVGIGNVTLAMGVAMIAGSLAYGPLDRLLGTRKGVLLGGNLMLAAALLMLWGRPDAGLAWAVAALCAVGFFGMSFPVMVAHGRSHFPPHLAGRGVTFLNLLAIGGAGLAQIASGRLAAVPRPRRRPRRRPTPRSSCSSRRSPSPAASSTPSPTTGSTEAPTDPGRFPGIWIVHERCMKRAWPHSRNSLI